MAKRVALTGNDAGAEAMLHIDPDVAAAFPITPQTEMMHKFAEFASDGKVKTEVVLVESEHSAMSACIGSAAAGARTMTATSSQGLALMWELLYIAAGLRLPMVMPVINRALSSPINIHGDHSDTMGARDTGWVQIFSENAQEVYDNVIQAVRIAEHKDVLLPTMATLDGFILSHTMETLEILEKDQVQQFIGAYRAPYTVLDTAKPITIGALDLTDYYFEHKRQEIEATTKVQAVVEAVGEEYGRLSGRPYGLMEGYRLEDAEIGLVALGSTCGTAKEAVNQARSQGIKAGLLKLRLFRPFPAARLAQALIHLKGIAVLDRSSTFGGEGGPLYIEVKSALYGQKIPLTNYLYGLGGRDIFPSDILRVFQETSEAAGAGELTSPTRYIGLRE